MARSCTRRASPERAGGKGRQRQSPVLRLRFGFPVLAIDDIDDDGFQIVFAVTFFVCLRARFGEVVQTCKVRRTWCASVCTTNLEAKVEPIRP